MRSNASPEYVVAVLAACSLEAAWITLAYVMVERLTRGPVPLSILAFAGASLVGLGIARASARGGSDPHRTLIAGIAVVVAIIGWLLPLGAGAGDLFETPMAVVGAHPGGFLLGLAFLRGTAHVTPEDDERIGETALGPGVALVALFWVFFTASGGNQEPAAVRAAFSATVTYVTAGLLSIGLARLADLRGSGALGADRRSWLGLVVGVVAGLLAVALPLALIIGVPIDAAIRGALGPIADVLVPVATLLLWPAGLLVAALVALFAFLRGNTPIGNVLPDWLAGAPAIGPGNPSDPSPGQGLDLSLVPLLIAIVVTFLLVRRLLKRPGIIELEGDVVEVREIERPAGGGWLRRPRLAIPHRQRDPETASEAYLASLELLARAPVSARLAAETPAEHARRLRADPVGVPLGRLAADFVLAEFGRRILAPSEHRRAVERWRRLRSTRGQ